MEKKELEQVAYCGLCCGDCFAHKGAIADLARDLRKQLRQSRFDKTAEALTEIPFFKALRNYSQCYEVLGALVRFRCKRSCRNGGGNPYCKIRSCCRRKRLAGCWECDDFGVCSKLDILKVGHGDAHLRNLRRIKRRGVRQFLKGKRDWYVKATT